MVDKHIVTERLAWTADKSRLVPYGHRDAAFLAYRPGDTIPLAVAEAAGLVAKPPEEVEVKQEAPSENKMVEAPENKGQIAKPEVKRKRGRPKVSR